MSAMTSYLSNELARALRGLQTLKGLVCLQHHTLTGLQHEGGLLDPQDGNQESVGTNNHLKILNTDHSASTLSDITMLSPALLFQQHIHKYIKNIYTLHNTSLILVSC